MATTVTLFRDPGDFNLMYGYNRVVLDNLEATADKYVLQIYVNNQLVSDVRQSPNSDGLAVFDIQKIIQSYTNSQYNIPSSAQWIRHGQVVSDVYGQTAYYELKYGSETAGVPDIQVNTNDYFVALPGRKNESYFITPLWTDESVFRAGYQPDPENPSCTDINDAGRVLTDIKQRIGVVPDNITGRLTSGEAISEREVLENDNYTLSLLQTLNVTGQALLGVDGVGAARVVAFNENGVQLDDFIIPNPFSNGAINPNFVVSIGIGPSNLNLSGSMPQGTKYYWVGFPLPTDVACGGVHPGYTNESAFGWHKFTIVEENCNDYDVLQFRWMNSLGFLDYFNFQKKNEKTMSVSRNTFLKERINYQSSGVIQSFRSTTTYSQEADEVWTANTGYLTDEESKYLENLFISPDVTVTFPAGMLNDTIIAQEVPVTVLSSSYTTKTYRKDKLFQYEIRFKFANKFKTQRG